MFNWTAERGNILFFRELLARAKVKLGKESIVQLLHPSNGDAPLLLACNKGKIKMVKELSSLKEMNILKARNGDNRTALHEAAENGYLEVVRLLLENPYLSKDEIMEFVNVKTAGESTAMDLAKNKTNENVAKVRCVFCLFFPISRAWKIYSIWKMCCNSEKVRSLKVPFSLQHRGREMFFPLFFFFVLFLFCSFKFICNCFFVELI